MDAVFDLRENEPVAAPPEAEVDDELGVSPHAKLDVGVELADVELDADVDVLTDENEALDD